MNQDVVDIFDGINNERKKAKQSLIKLKKESFRIKTNLVTNVAYLQLLRIKNKGRSTESVEWRTLEKLPSFCLSEGRWVKSTDEARNLRSFQPTVFPFFLDEFIGEILGNRNYFKPCFNCGLLAHAGKMVNRVCLRCIAEGNADKQKVRNEFVSNFIKVKEYSGMVFDILFKDIKWQGPHEAVEVFGIVTPSPIVEPIPRNDSKKLDQAINRVLANRQCFNVCLGCGKWKHVGHMGGSCYSCMEDSGVVF